MKVFSRWEGLLFIERVRTSWKCLEMVVHGGQAQPSPIKWTVMFIQEGMVKKKFISQLVWVPSTFFLKWGVPGKKMVFRSDVFQNPAWIMFILRRVFVFFFNYLFIYFKFIWVAKGWRLSSGKSCLAAFVFFSIFIPCLTNHHQQRDKKNLLLALFV